MEFILRMCRANATPKKVNLDFGIGLWGLCNTIQNRAKMGGLIIARRDNVKRSAMIYKKKSLVSHKFSRENYEFDAFTPELQHCFKVICK